MKRITRDLASRSGWVAGLLGAVTLGLPATVLATWASGGGSVAAELAAAAGWILAIAALPVGTLLFRIDRNVSPPALMAIGLGGYLVVASTLWLTYLILDATLGAGSRWVGVGLLAGTAGWLVAQLSHTVLGRQPLFDLDPLDLVDDQAKS